MALETGRRVFPGIEDEFASPAAACHMQARRSVARLAARLPNCAGVFQVNAGVGTGRENAGDALMALDASLIADETCPRNSGRRGDRHGSGGTRIHQQGDATTNTKPHHECDLPPQFHVQVRPL